ncbi:MAG: dihydroxy-acid dehydratase [Limisphaera sp.]|nr:dihydroxy-acid dehydratase [Limisphaera sp.]
MVILRNEDLRGGPGMQQRISHTSDIVGMGPGDTVAFVTDGRLNDRATGAMQSDTSAGSD